MSKLHKATYCTQAANTSTKGKASLLHKATYERGETSTTGSCGAACGVESTWNQAPCHPHTHSLLEPGTISCMIPFLVSASVTFLHRPACVKDILC